MGILLTDEPADLSVFSGVMIKVDKVELFSASDDRVTVFDGPTTDWINLLRLRNSSRPLTFRDGVSADWYCKIRLTLHAMELRFRDGSPAFRPNLPGNRKLDLNPRECFYVRAGGTVYLQMDLDMGRSIHIVKKGFKDEYNVRPVAFIDVIKHDFPGKLVRLEGGKITAVNERQGTVLLCRALPVYGESSRTGPDRCVTVRVTRQTSAFDNVVDDVINSVANGDAIPLNELLRTERVGTTPVTVVGHFRAVDESIDIPDGHLPPPGECKVWFRDRPPGQQPAPDDCDKLDDDLPPGAILVGHDYNLHRQHVVFDALVVELGAFLQLNGTVSSGASDIRFNMQVAAGEPVSVEGDLPVALQSAPSGGNGTKILSKTGEVISYTDITDERDVTVDGVLILDSPNFLNSALVIVDTDALAKDIASGQISRLAGDRLLLDADAFPCETGSGSFVVTFDEGTDVYRIRETRDGFTGEFVRTSALALGQVVDISGQCVGTDLAADTIIILKQ